MRFQPLCCSRLCGFTSLLFCLLCGCSDKQAAINESQAKRIAELEHTVSRQRIDIDILRTNLSNALVIVSTASSNQLQSLSQVKALVIEKAEQDRVISEMMAKLLAATTNQPKSPYGYARPVASSRPVTVVQMRDGVPLPIYNQIVEKAQSEFPSDYTLQAASIRMETEAYRKLHPN